MMVDQTTFFSPENPKGGNCAEACVATILGIPLEEVPTFANAGPDVIDYFDAFEFFMAKRGYHVYTKGGDYRYEGLCLTSGMSSRGCSHMVIRKNGVLFHDPHPSRAGLLSVRYTHLLIPMDPRGVVYPQVF